MTSKKRLRKVIIFCASLYIIQYRVERRMEILTGFFWIFGGVGVFMLGLKFVSENFALVFGKGLQNGLKKMSKSHIASLFVGAGASALFQSSVAVNMILISLVESSLITLSAACAVILGTNIGTTVTAQLVSASLSKAFSVGAAGAFVGFVGFLLSLSSNKKASVLGNVAIGFGLIFVGIEIMTKGVQSFYAYAWFKNLFLIKSPLILLLNGFFVTAICQSSSVVTSMLVILASGQMVDIQSAVYLILGANVGTCISVIFVSHKMRVESRRTAYFNLLFNIFGGIIFFFIMLFFGDKVGDFLIRTSASYGGAVANFHTAFNVFMSLLTLPFIKTVCRLTEFFTGLPSADEKSAKKTVNSL